MTSRGLKLVAIALGLALVAAVVALVVLARHDDGSEASSAKLAAAAAADQAARTAVVAMTTYDYRTVEKDFGWVRSAGTEAFQKKYAEASTPVKALVRQLKARAQGKVIDSAAVARDPTHVKVLLFVDQTITNASQRQAANLDQPRITMRMVLQDGRWLVDAVDLASQAR